MLGLVLTLCEIDPWTHLDILKDKCSHFDKDRPKHNDIMLRPIVKIWTQLVIEIARE